NDLNRPAPLPGRAGGDRRRLLAGSRGGLCRHSPATRTPEADERVADVFDLDGRVQQVGPIAVGVLDAAQQPLEQVPAVDTLVDKESPTFTPPGPAPGAAGVIAGAPPVILARGGEADHAEARDDLLAD